MKIYISYFYQIRFMNKDLLPISTAKWDPKWFHNNGTSKTKFRDKNNVVNGLRFEILSLPSYIYDSINDNKKCENCNRLEKIVLDHHYCTFMSLYYMYLHNHVDSYFPRMIEKMYDLLMLYNARDIVLIVHEASNCPCAERPILIRWFRDHGYNVEEWNKEKI